MKYGPFKTHITDMNSNWSTRKYYSSDGRLIKMEHSYNFMNATNYLSPVKTSSKYVYSSNSESSDLILPEEKSLYASDMEFPLPWKEPVGASLDDSDEDRQIKAEWFQFVKKRRLGKNWRDENNKLANIVSHPNVIIHNKKLYEDWVKRKGLYKVPFTYAFFSREKWMENGKSMDFSHEKPCSLEILPIFQENAVNEIIVTGPTDPRILKEPNNNVVNGDSPVKDTERKSCKFDIKNYSAPIKPRKTIFKNPAKGIVKLIKNKEEAILTAEWEGKKIDIMFFKWNYLPKDREKLKFDDPLHAFLKVGQEVSFHGARTIPDTEVYETLLVYEGNNYPTLASRSCYNLKKWFIEKDLYTFPRIATVKSTILPYHAAIDIDKPSRNSSHRIAAIMVGDLYINKDDANHPEGWIDDFIQAGDKIFVELQYLRDDSAGIKKAWKFPAEEIINPRKVFIPRKLRKDKFVFACREGKTWHGTVRDVNENDGIFLTHFKDKVYEVFFNQVFINGFEVGINEVQTGDEIRFTHFRLIKEGEEHWCPRIWKGQPPNVSSLMKKYDEKNRDAVVDNNSVYAGKIVEFLLPSHAVLKAKANNDADVFVLLSEGEILPNSPFWIDKILKMDDVLTFKVIRTPDVRFFAVQVQSCFMSKNFG